MTELEKYDLLPARKSKPKPFYDPFRIAREADLKRLSKNLSVKDIKIVNLSVDGITPKKK